MTVRVKFAVGEHQVDEVVNGASADELLSQAKERVIQALGWKGIFLRPLTPVQFGQLVVAKYNENFGTHFPNPATGEEFIEFGLVTGNVQVLER